MAASTSTSRVRLRSVLCAWLAALVVALPAFAEPREPVLLVVGDSISAGYGLPAGTVWVDLLAARLRTQGYRYRVVNASITGDTTAGGRARLTALLVAHQPAIVIIELGGNDALRGLALAATEDNLAVMARQSREAGARVLLLGMQVPPNYGRAYTDAFAALFRSVADREKAALLPFFLDGVAERPELFQPDRIHPNEAAQSRMLDNVWPALRPLLG